MTDDSCWVCRVLAGTSPGHVVVADDDVAVLVMPLPVNPGHALVVPRRHVKDVYELPAGLGGPLLDAAARIARAQKRALGSEGTTLRQHNEPAGGQEVFHFHLHVIPRFAGDEERLDARNPLVSLDDQEAMAARLRDALSREPRP